MDIIELSLDEKHFSINLLKLERVSTTLLLNVNSVLLRLSHLIRLKFDYFDKNINKQKIM